MQPKSAEKVIQKISKSYGLSDKIEISLEANPTSSNQQKFAEFVQAGINRFSIGVQNLDNEQLQFLGREHSANEALHTVEEAMKVCSNVNLDIIYGLPHENFQKWCAHVKRVLEFQSQHISAYQLTIEPNTVFHKQVKIGQWSPLTTDAQCEYFDFICETLETYGYVNYEISNHARPGFECQHNLHVWKYGDYLGIGAGAHGRWCGIHKNYASTRAYKIPAAYINAINEYEHALFEKTSLKKGERTHEHMLMSFRLKEGIPLELVEQAIEHNLLDVKQLEQMLLNGFVHKTTSHLALTPKGWPLLDAVLERLTSP